MAMLWSGDDTAGADLVQVMRDLKPELDLVGPMTYATPLRACCWLKLYRPVW